MKSSSKKATGKKSFYLPILNFLKTSTNLTDLRRKLNIPKQNLNYYLRELRKKGFIYKKYSGRNGWYELTEKGKNPTKYDIFLKEDMIRGHAYIWEVEIENIPENWNKRIEILKQKEINFNLVGALKTTPRIKVLGRKVWLCNDHLRIFDIKKQSYYGDTPKESRINSKFEAKRIVLALENKLGIKLNPDKIKFKKEHYALIRNGLAIDQNQKGIIMRIKDENGEEWLLIDDSLGEGGELEVIGKKSYQRSPKLQKWWNENKEVNFKWSGKQIEQTMNLTEERFLRLAKQNEFLAKTLEEMNKREAIMILEINNLKNNRN